MDGLITLLIIFGIFALKSSRKKQRAQQQAARKNGFKEAGETLAKAQEKIPFSREEWTAYLKAQAQPEEKKPAARPVAAKPAAKPVAVKPAPVKPTPVRALEHDDPEGTISTQGTHSTEGETAAEHAEHRLKVLREEASRRLEHEAIQDLKSMNLKKLRSAVVMSEVLDKPVSLRRRGYR